MARTADAIARSQVARRGPTLEVDRGAWVGVVGRKGLVRRGVARARGWKIRGEG